MKKLFLPIFLFTISLQAVAEEEKKNTYDQVWFSLGYSYFIAEEAKGNPLGPATATVGVQLWKWLVLDMSLGYVWSLDYDNADKHKGTDLDYFPVRAVLMYQPDIPIKSVENFSLRPYAGIGPMFAINGTNFSNSNFSGGFSAKAGLRIRHKHHLYGIGLEYLFNHAHIDYNGTKSNYNASGLAIGAEIGFTF